MFSKSLLLRIAFAVLGLGAISTMAYYGGMDPSKWFDKYPGTIYEEEINQGLEPNLPDLPNIGLAAPEITDQKKENECGTQLWWYDNEKNEDNVFFYRRVVGVTDFVPFKVTGPHAGGPGSFGEANLPPGTYEYKVSVVSELGEAFSNVSLPITIDSDVCSDNTIPNKPLNPVIISLERFVDNTCAIRVKYQDNSLNEDGIRIYRESSENGFNEIMIAELPSSDAPTGYYDDLNLPPAIYRYRVSVFNQDGESFSQHSEEFPIQDEDCNVFDPPVIQLPTVGPVNLPSDASQACIWTSTLNVFIRKGPSSTLYSDITAVVAGTSLPIVGQSEDGQFWVVEVQPSVLGYVPKAEKFGSTTGDCNPPTLQDREPPITEPPASNQPQTPACNDGVDNDGDNLVDMRDRECASPDDTSE
ncbi:MAG: hypothetical protein HYZ22_20215 [Chloroflexi bacterium]|nr:hypothetical protein [Chloroflexota bacterium]